MKRLLFLSPDVEHARHMVGTLRRAGIPEKHLYVVASGDTPLEDLPDAGPEADDFLPAWERGLALGGVGGLVAGLAGLAFPPAGLTIGGGAVLLVTLFGAGLGGFLAGLAGAAFPSSRLAEFERAIEAGQVLVLADVPADEVQDYEALIRETDPEVRVEGIEPPAPAIPR
jgi:hypothetical protein